MENISRSSLVHQAEIEPALTKVQNNLPQFQKVIADLIATKGEITSADVAAAMAAANGIDQDATQLSRLVRDEAHMEHMDLSARFRREVLVLAVIAILVINLSIVALLRLTLMILRPVESLVGAAHDLGQGHFDRRVEIKGNDEFGQLAEAYNRMAEQLQAAEQRRMEVMSQVALTMNHELNNLINIIELQLTLLSRRTGEAETQQAHLKQIRASLDKITRVVDALKHARRIVLTDYMAGVKMLDLRKSTQESDLEDQTVAAQCAPEFDV
jgi:nitrogen fixation/metabolism regulation signal transduction histidine kinase